ncbi:hypothetical protein FJW06_15015 [Mesorhizobium sp. B4-1-3]|uniref:hypothetical protein n=1 Tax=Mesorhizobium sp. B4-1-3 TaxID=2589889 RepID=UPI001125E7C3|nr:hypothetical protein [Mesorhizobium sp. B4-1-3]TPI12980.1 hypothetical protein FJW06_15015 [Mesorhizobium sp. B4-1-3]
MFNPWVDLSFSILEAQQVIWLRGMRIASGGKAAEREAKLMIGEKIEAAGRATMMLAMGAPADKVVSYYGGKIRANRKRLLRSPA